MGGGGELKREGECEENVGVGSPGKLLEVVIVEEV